MKNIKYSICICNYNMSYTLEKSLCSVLDQIDETYEVIVVDDGSSDNSLEILEKLSNNYENLKYYTLERDKSRKLGKTRNYSVSKANGEYILLHIDTDDFWEPYINEFVKIFHEIESSFDHDILLSGQQINIGKKVFLQSHGPYRNTRRAEDRDLWLRLAAINAYQPIKHKVFRSRLERPERSSLKKSMRDTWDHLHYDFCRGMPFSKYFMRLTKEVLHKDYNSIKIKLYKVLILPFVYISSLFSEKFPPPKELATYEKFKKYREVTNGTAQDIMKRNNKELNIDQYSKTAKEIFLIED